jgi:hypothetical protein
LPTGQCNITRSFSINSESLSRLELTFVNGGKRRGVNHRLGLLADNTFLECGQVRDIHLRQVRGNDFVTGHQAGREVPTQHTLVSGD